MIKLYMYAQGVVTCKSLENDKVDEAISLATRAGYTVWKIKETQQTTRHDY